MFSAASMARLIHNAKKSRQLRMEQQDNDNDNAKENGLAGNRTQGHSQHFFRRAALLLRDEMLREYYTTKPQARLLVR